MSADNPTEYVQKLEAENRALRRQLTKALAEQIELKQQLAMANVMYLRAATLPHPFE